MKKFFLLIPLFFLSCTESTQQGIRYHSYPDFLNKKAKIKIKKTSSLPTTVAILPFKAKNNEDSLIVTNTFYNYFSILPYNDIELSKIRDIYKHKFFDLNTSKKELNNICNRLGSDGLIYGNVKNLGKLYLGVYSEVSVGAKLNFYDCNTKEIIWQFEKVSKKREGGISTTPWGIAINAIIAAYNLRKVQIYRAAEDLFRDIPNLIPHRKFNIKTAITPPTFIYHSGMKKSIFGIGDKIKIKIAAKPNLKIFAKIDKINQIPLKEIKKGLYEGYYTVKPGDNCNCYLKITLINNYQKADFFSFTKIHIDTTPPKINNIDISYANKAIIKVNTTDNILEYTMQILKNNKWIDFKTSKNGIFKLNYDNKTLICRVKITDLAKNVTISNAFKLYLYQDKNVAKAKEYVNEEVIEGIIKISNSLSLDKLYVSKDSYLIIMPNVIANIKTLKVDGSISIINATINTSNFTVTNLAKIYKSTINSNKFGIIFQDKAKGKIQKSIINSKFSSLLLKDASKVVSKNCKFNSKDVFANILITGLASIDLIDPVFNNISLYNIVSNSKRKSFVNKQIKYQGNIYEK